MVAEKGPDLAGSLVFHRVSPTWEVCPSSFPFTLFQAHSMSPAKHCLASFSFLFSAPI